MKNAGYVSINATLCYSNYSKYHVSPATYDHIGMIRKSIPSASLIYSITSYHILYQFRIGKRYHHGSEWVQYHQNAFRLSHILLPYTLVYSLLSFILITTKSPLAPNSIILHSALTEAMPLKDKFLNSDISLFKPTKHLVNIFLISF